MEVVGSEIGQKMRSAIKAKLTELGCYVDDELPDYVMVMVANKRTRTQMEDDLQLFLGDNTELFVGWLHQVLKKLQEVTVTAPLKPEPDNSKEIPVVKEKKPKDKKTKEKVKKSDSSKKSKKKDKEKTHHKKKEEKVHKSKKKSKHHEMIRPNIPPLLMNIEKDSEPSITDVFAGQILKNHGITVDQPKEDPKVDTKPIVVEVKRPILPIIDPATITSQIEISESDSVPTQVEIPEEPVTASVSSTEAPREEQLREMHVIENKIQGLKQKLAEQLDSMSDDEDFLNIRTEADELMNDFAEDVLQEISQQAPSTPPPPKLKSPSPIAKPKEQIKEYPKDPVESLPQIELNLPKRPIRERLGGREQMKMIVEEKPADKIESKAIKRKRIETPERFTPEREPEHPPPKSVRSRLGDAHEQKRSSISTDDSDRPEMSTKRLTSKVSVLENRAPRSSFASVVRVRPRPRAGAPASSLLLRAVADAHKSLLNIPPKPEQEPQIKRALVLPMRRCVDAQKIVIQVAADGDGDKMLSEEEVSKEEYVPAPVTRKASNADYVPSRRAARSDGRTSKRKDDTLIIETINIHHQTVDKEKDTQFIVTMDGFNPNAFLAKRLKTEGLLEEEEEEPKTDRRENISLTEEIVNKQESTEIEKVVIENTEVPKHVKTIVETQSPKKAASDIVEPNKSDDDTSNSEPITSGNDKSQAVLSDGDKSEQIKSDTVKSRPKRTDAIPTQKKRLSDTSEESDTQVIIQTEERPVAAKRMNSSEVTREENSAKKRASPIVFDVDKKEKEVTQETVRERVRERTESASSDNHVIVTTMVDPSKYESIPPLSKAVAGVPPVSPAGAGARKPVWCREFPLCRYGAGCAYAHPRCKFATACTRRGCAYSHPPNAKAAVAPAIASHVVPAANYKSISSAAPPGMCKYYPACSNPACHYFHPKPCRYGKACLNKLECNFYHIDAPAGKWKYP